MDRLIDFPGKRGFVNDDLVAIQGALDILLSIWKDAGPFVVRGVEATLVSGNLWSFSEGIVAVNGKMIEFPAQQIDLTQTKAIAEAPVQLTADREYYLLNTVKPGIEYNSLQVISAANPVSGDNLFILSDGYIRRLRDAINDLTIAIGTIRHFAADIQGLFDTNGKGVGTMRGWSLANGNILNGAPQGSPNLQNNILVGAGFSFSLGDTSNIEVANQATNTFTTYALYMLIRAGTHNLYNTI